jgi:alpha-mannosidase
VPGEAGHGSYFWVEANNVIIETVKPAEDGSGEIIVRLYEAMRTATRCALHYSLPVSAVYETDMLETLKKELAINIGYVPLSFRPFEIKTLRMKLAEF